MGFKRFLVAGVVAVVAAQTIGLASASAGELKLSLGAKAQVTGSVVIDEANPQIAYVSARYQCPAGSTPHLWVSVKQVASGAPDKALTEEGSSGISAAWLQRHPDPATEFTCDGAWHTGTWSIDAGLTEYGFGALKTGQVYVQFCLTGPETPEGFEWAAFSQRFASAE